MSNREYPRLVKGVVIYGPSDDPEVNREPANPKAAININAANVDALRKIRGVGKKTAQDIVASREADGPFDSLEDCANRVGGVSLEQLEAADVTV